MIDFTNCMELPNDYVGSDYRRTVPMDRRYAFERMVKSHGLRK